MGGGVTVTERIMGKQEIDGSNPPVMSREESFYHQAVLFSDLPLLFPDHAPSEDELNNDPQWQAFREHRLEEEMRKGNIR